MKKQFSFGLTVLVLLLLAMVAVLPVSAEVTVGSSAAAPTATTLASATLAKPFISATVSNQTPTVGDPITISGAETGGNVSSGVQIWIFAGNYVNVDTVPVNPDGTFSRTYNTTGYPPATYYVFVQNPGPDGIFSVGVQGSGIYSGQVINTQTNTLLFNFTGTGSVQDAAAAQKLSDAINLQGGDDVYTKLTFQLMAPAVPGTPAPVATTVVPSTTVPPTKKSPLPLEATFGAVVIGGLGAVLFARRS